MAPTPSHNDPNDPNDPNGVTAAPRPRARRARGFAALDPHRASTVRQSRARIEARSDELAERFYQALFERAPQLQALFPLDRRGRHDQLRHALAWLLGRIDHTHGHHRHQLAARLADLGRDHRKFGVRASHYHHAGQALLTALAHIHGPSWSPQLATAWTSTCTAVTQEILGAAAAERGPALWLGRVLTHRRHTPDLATVIVQALDPIPYQPGQYLSVEIPQHPGHWRYLSPAEPARPDGVLRFLVRAIPGGRVSPTLVAHTRTGDTWRIGPALGQLTHAPTTGRDLLMLGSGTGLAPLSALIAELDQTPNPPRTHLYLGARSSADLDILIAATALSRHHPPTRPWLTFTPVTPRHGAPAPPGSVAETVLRNGTWDHHDVVICGPPAMQESSIQQLRAAAVPTDQLHNDPSPSIGRRRTPPAEESTHPGDPSR